MFPLPRGNCIVEHPRVPVVPGTSLATGNRQDKAADCQLARVEPFLGSRAHCGVPTVCHSHARDRFGGAAPSTDT